MGRATFEVRKARDAQFFWALVGGNGEDLATSETYTREVDAVRGAKGARKAARFARVTVEENPEREVDDEPALEELP